MEGNVVDYTPRPMPLLAKLNTRAALLIAAAIAFVLTVLALTGPSTVGALLVITGDGVIALLWILGACGLGDAILPRDEAVPPPLRVATAGGLGLGVFSLLGLLLGLLGWLNRPIAIAFPVAGAAMWSGITLWRHRRWLASSPSLSLDPIRAWLAEPAGIGWLWLIPVIALSMACVGASVFPGVLWKPLDPHPYDVVSYHLQVPREWYELGRIVPLTHNVFSYFPFNIEMQYLLLMHATGGPWAGMYACQFLNVGLTVLLLLAIAGAGRGGLVAAAVVSAVPWVTMLACVAYVESGLLLYSTLALIWAMKSMGGTPLLLKRVSYPLLLSGVFAGLAAGVKITAAPMLILPIAIAIAIPVVQWRRLAVKSIGFSVIAFLITAAVVLSPWLIRNLVWAHNPIFPLAMNLLGRAHFSLEQVERFRVAHSPRPDQAGLLVRVKILWTGVLAHWQYGFVLLPVGAIAAVRRTRASAFLCINAVVVLIVWLGFTHLLPRFAISLVPIAAIALAAVEWGRFKPAGVILAIVAAACGLIAVTVTLHEQIGPIAENHLFGVDKLDFELVEDVHKLDPAGGKSVAMIGDAGAFLVQLPMSQLRYRCVFDLPAGVTDPIEAWAGPGVHGNPGWLLSVHPSEIDRLHETYLYTPALPPALASPGDQPYVVPATNVP